MVPEPRSLLALAIQLACAVVAVLVVPPSGGPRARVRVAAALACVALAAPFASADVDSFFRCGQSLLAGVAAGRVADLARDGRSWPTRTRVASLFVLFDLRAVVHNRTGTATGLIAGGLLSAAVAGLGVWLGLGSDEHVGPTRLAMRWGGGVLVVYGVLDAYAKLGLAAFHVAGWTAQPIHRDPILSATLAEFWGQRWNLVVHGWILRHVVRRVARRGRGVALAAAFVASALLHAYVVLASTERADHALMIAAYFLLQGIGWSLAARLRLAGLAARALTVVWVLVPSPLFVEPLVVALLGR